MKMEEEKSTPRKQQYGGHTGNSIGRRKTATRLPQTDTSRSSWRKIWKVAGLPRSSPVVLRNNQGLHMQAPRAYENTSRRDLDWNDFCSGIGITTKVARNVRTSCFSPTRIANGLRRDRAKHSFRTDIGKW